MVTDGPMQTCQSHIAAFVGRGEMRTAAKNKLVADYATALARYPLGKKNKIDYQASEIQEPPRNIRALSRRSSNSEKRKLRSGKRRGLRMGWGRNYFYVCSWLECIEVEHRGPER